MKGTILKVFLLLFALTTFCKSTAQVAQDNIDNNNTHKPIYISSKIERGIIANQTEFTNGKNYANKRIKNFNAYSTSIGWQTTGKHNWEIIHDLPSWGLTLYTVRFDHDKELGKPFSLTGFYNGTFKRWDNHAIRYKVRLGLAFNWRKFDLESNPNNIQVGSPMTSHVGYEVEYEYVHAGRLILAAGGSLTHFSNGSIRRPNKGINMASLHARVGYYLQKFQPRTITKQRERLVANELQWTVSYAFRHVDMTEEKYYDTYSKYINKPMYHAATIKSAFLHQYSYKAKVGGGLNICWDDYLDTGLLLTENGNFVKTGGRFSRQVNYSLFVTHEYLINNLAIVSDMGAYIYQPKARTEGQACGPKKKKPVFERAGLKYYLPMNLHVGFNIYAHFSKADFLEWNMGYRIRWGEKTVSRK